LKEKEGQKEREGERERCRISIMNKSDIYIEKTQRSILKL
jgi:hypothetical protein